ncbi:MAG: HNH endonuclease [Anaerolineales bacterium]|nr:HNH endonuclease [Anaerolineales bacterium]
MVTQRAQGYCEYCRIHHEDTPLNHTLDHIIALKHGGKTDESNLALACLECNLNKGSDLTTFDPLSGDIVPLYHPRQQIWSDHFVVESAYLVGKTAHGRATIRLLQLNAPERIQQRQLLIAIGRYHTP